MTQRANAKPAIRWVVEQALDEGLPYFSSGAGDEDPVLLGSRVALVARRCVSRMHGYVVTGRNSTGCIPRSLRYFVKWNLSLGCKNHALSSSQGRGPAAVGNLPCRVVGPTCMIGFAQEWRVPSRSRAASRTARQPRFARQRLSAAPA